MHDLTSLKRDMIVVISGLNYPSGQDVKRELEKYYDGEVSNLYPNLDSLVYKGLIRKGKKDDRTNYYALTMRGRRTLHRRTKWQDGRISEIIEQ